MAVIRGLRSQPELNGVPCIICGYDAARQRYGVLPQGRGERVALKPCSVVLEPGLTVRLRTGPESVRQLHAEIAEVLDDGARYALALDAPGAPRLIHVDADEVLVFFD